MGPSLFTFSGYLNATLPGNSKVCPEPFDNAAIAAEDAFEGVAVVLLRAGSTSSCWPSPNYADSNYPLTVGWLTSESVVIDGVSSNATYKAYQFDAPQEASQYRASEHALFFWPSMGNVSYTVWSYHNGIMLPLAHIQEEVIEAAFGKNVPEVKADLEFVREESDTLHGRTSVACPSPFDDAVIDSRDMVGTIAIVTLPQGGTGGCWTTPAYSHADYPAEVGTLVDEAKDIYFENAIRISEPNTVATSFSASPLGLYFNPIQGNVSYTVWTYDGAVVSEIAQVNQTQVELAFGKNMAPVLGNFTFNIEDGETLHGRTSEACPSPFDDAVIDSGDIIGNVAIVTLPQGGTGSCWTTPAYSNGDFPVLAGNLVDETKDIFFDNAIQISAPLSVATQFAASEVGLYFRPFHGNVSYKLWSTPSDGSSISEVAFVSQALVEEASGKNGGFVNSGVVVSDIYDQIITILPASTDVFALLSTDTYNGFVNSGVVVSDLLGKTAFILPSSIDVRSQLQTHPGGMVNSGLLLSDLSDQGVLLIEPSTNTVSDFPRWDDLGVEAAVVTQDWFSMMVRRYDVEGVRPFDPRSDWLYSPAHHSHKYSTRKRFFAIQESASPQREGVVFQDEETGAIYVTWLGTDDDDSCQGIEETFELSSGNMTTSILYGAVSDGARIFYLLVEDVEENELAAQILRVDSSGVVQASRFLDTQASGLDMKDQFSAAAALAFRPAGADSHVNATIGAILSRGMWNSHQGAIAVVIDAETLEVIKNLGQTSGHSFANRLGVSSDDSRFVGVDLGDNFPRGINVHSFDSEARDSNVVYHFKTRHSTEFSDSVVCANDTDDPESNCIYSNISTPSTTYYKHSNDNNVYTEITQLLQLGPESNNGFLIFFAGERRPLDNSQVGQALNNPRNLGLIRTTSDVFSSENVASVIIRIELDGSSGVETGQYFDFGGGLNHQENVGILWLTAYGSPPIEGSSDVSENVSRIKAVHLGKDQNLVVFEVWSSQTYLRTMLMLISDAGVIVHGPTEADYPLRLGPADDMVVRKSHDRSSTVAVAYSGATFLGSDSDAHYNKLIRFDIVLNDSSNITGAFDNFWHGCS